MSVNIDLVFRPDDLSKGELEGRVAIVVDVLRASTTIIAALDAGAVWVEPVVDVEKARIKKAASEVSVLLAGERGGLAPEGFDLGNSPLEYVPEKVGGRGIFLTTTNGTRTLALASEASQILVGALLNASAVASVALKFDSGISIVCAGTEEKFSADDVVAGGAIVDAILRMDKNSQLSDRAFAALGFFQNHRGDLEGCLQSCKHGRKLLSLGLGPDLRKCAELDTVACVPQQIDGRLVKEQI